MKTDDKTSQTMGPDRKLSSMTLDRGKRISRAQQLETSHKNCTDSWSVCSLFLSTPAPRSALYQRIPVGRQLTQEPEHSACMEEPHCETEQRRRKMEEGGSERGVNLKDKIARYLFIFLNPGTSFIQDIFFFFK